jgi:hypothetical protein
MLFVQSANVLLQVKFSRINSLLRSPCGCPLAGPGMYGEEFSEVMSFRQNGRFYDLSGLSGRCRPGPRRASTTFRGGPDRRPSTGAKRPWPTPEHQDAHSCTIRPASLSRWMSTLPSLECSSSSPLPAPAGAAFLCYAMPVPCGRAPPPRRRARLQLHHTPHTEASAVP